MYNSNLAGFTDVLGDEIGNSQESQPLSLSSGDYQINNHVVHNAETSTVSYDKEENNDPTVPRPAKGTGQYGQFRSIDEIDEKYRSVFSYPFFNLVQSNVIEDALYSDKSMVVCAPTGSGKTVVFEMAIVQLLMEIEDTNYMDDFKIIYSKIDFLAPVKAVCTERLTEWYPKFTKLGLLCIVVTGDTDIDFSQLKPYRIIITTPEKWDMVTRRWREHRQLVEVIKLFLIDEVHILNDGARGPVLEAVVSRMKTIESSAQSAHRIEQLQKQYQGIETASKESPPKIRFVAVSATVSNPEDVAAWLGTAEKPAVYYKFGDESRPVKLKRIVEGYPCPEGTSIFKFDIILNYKLWPLIQKYHNGKPTLIFCNTRKSVALTAETLSRELTVSFSPEQKAKLTALASKIKNKKLQALVLSGVGCHHAGLLFEERNYIEQAFRNRDLPILITTTTLAMGVNLPAHLVIIKNTQQYVNGAYQEYSISTVLQMVGRAGRPQFDTEATAVIMTRICDKPRYQALVGGSEPLQSYLHKRLAENLNSEAALGTVNDVAQCVQWLRSTFLCVRAARDPKRYLGLPQAAPQQLISKKIEELCVKAMNGLATSGLITMDEASCIESTEAGRLMSIYYLDLETMKHIMKINGTETLERLLWVVCESHELADMHLRVDERRCLNTLNRNNAATTIRFPMKGKISTRQMKLNCIIQAVLGCLNIPDPSLNQEAMKIMRIADRVCKCLVAYVTRPAITSQQSKHHSAVLNALILAKCVAAQLWENSPYVSKQLKGIGPTFSTLLASAGKVNFMLLEESHPRDLERIMNKGPPAGNVHRKQISLLPKYQLTMTPIDEKSVTMQLILLNQNYLSENVEQLTAGPNHKSYVVVGDSENNLLMLTSFKDKDLISIYDGTITLQLTRAHSFEHKMFVNCISSSFVGIDAHCEYLFKDLEAISPSRLTTNAVLKKSVNKQTTITDTFKERKRKNVSDNDITQSKEKKKRDNVLFEKFKYLKESFGKTSKEMKEDLDKSVVTSNKILQVLTQSEKPAKVTENINENATIEPEEETNTEIIESDDNFIDDDKINSILNEIENEISKETPHLDLPRVELGAIKNTQSYIDTESGFTNLPLRKNNSGRKIYHNINNTKKGMQRSGKSNYNFIDLLEKNINESEEKPVNESSGFSDTIKSQIEKYLQNAKCKFIVPDKPMTELLQVEDNEVTVRTEKDNSSNRNFKTDMTVTCIPEIESGKYNEAAHLSMQINVEENNSKNDDDVGRIIHEIECEMHDINRTELINDNSSTVPANETYYGLQINTNDNNMNTLPIQNAISNVNTSNLGITKQNEQTSDSILHNNAQALVPVQSHDGNGHLNLKCHNSYETTPEPNIAEQLSTGILALPYKQAQPQTNTIQNICKENTVHFRNDVNMEQSFSRLTPTIDSKPDKNVISSENCHKTYEKKDNLDIRKYSYSSIKIGIASATEDNHVVRVIRKIKMNLDVTEIISREEERYRLQEIKMNTNDEAKRDAQKSFTDFEVTQPHKIHIQDVEIINNNKSNVNYEVINKDIQGIITQKNNKPTLAPAITSSSPQFDLLSKQTKHIIFESDNNMKIKEDNSANETPSPLKGDNRVEDILQKYSKILKKNSTGHLSQSLTQPKVTEKTITSTPSEKPKRPFKITDINNLSSPLPQTLISETYTRQSIVESNNETSKRENIVDTRNEIEQKEEITLLKENFHSPPELKDSPWQDFNKQCNIGMDQNEDLEENWDEELSEYKSVNTVEDHESQQPESDYNIDQSMLNPKTLLLCLSKDEPDIIVPPPPEFCDEIEDITLNNDDMTIPVDCYEPMRWEHFDKNDETKNIFQDDSQSELTPRKEIETWTLSQNDESYGNLEAATNFNPQTFTIMNNSRQRKSSFQNVSVTRRNRLGQFKFCRKSKLLPKK